MSGMTMLERAALAICNQMRADHDFGPLPDLSNVEDSGPMFRYVRAALEAIREPSIDAKYSGQNCSPDHDSDYGSDDSEYRYLSNKGAGEVFTAMIDHIIGGGE